MCVFTYIHYNTPQIADISLILHQSFNVLIFFTFGLLLDRFVQRKGSLTFFSVYLFGLLNMHCTFWFCFYFLLTARPTNTTNDNPSTQPITFESSLPPTLPSTSTIQFESGSHASTVLNMPSSQYKDIFVGYHTPSNTSAHGCRCC